MPPRPGMALRTAISSGSRPDIVLLETDVEIYVSVLL
jgi:hypothetical protein